MIRCRVLAILIVDITRYDGIWAENEDNYIKNVHQRYGYVAVAELISGLGSREPPVD